MSRDLLWSLLQFLPPGSCLRPLMLGLSLHTSGAPALELTWRQFLPGGAHRRMAHPMLGGKEALQRFRVGIKRGQR